MADVQLRSVIRMLRRIIGRRRARSQSDAEVLDAFLQRRDENAVEMLVWRHGTMVLNLCRRVLQNEHHAEDAFQATFLVFVRKARSIGGRKSVGELAVPGGLPRGAAAEGQVGETAHATGS